MSDNQLTYLWDGEKQIGPFTTEQIINRIRQGHASLETMYWREGQADWTPLNELPEIVSTYNPTEVTKVADSETKTNAKSWKDFYWLGLLLGGSLSAFGRFSGQPKHGSLFPGGLAEILGFLLGLALSGLIFSFLFLGAYRLYKRFKK